MIIEKISNGTRQSKLILLVGMHVSCNYRCAGIDIPKEPSEAYLWFKRLGELLGNPMPDTETKRYVWAGAVMPQAIFAHAAGLLEDTS